MGRGHCFAYYDVDTTGQREDAHRFGHSCPPPVCLNSTVPRGEFYIYAGASDGIQVIGRTRLSRCWSAPPAPTGLKFAPR
jgi:hypothetical protein